MTDIGFEAKSAAALRFLRDYTREHGASPTVREIGEAVGYANPGAAHRLLKRMEDEGMIDVGAMHSPRTIRVRPTPVTGPRNRDVEL